MSLTADQIFESFIGPKLAALKRGETLTPEEWSQLLTAIAAEQLTKIAERMEAIERAGDRPSA